MKTTIVYGSIFIAIIYWITTFVFVLPENYVNIYFTKQFKYFDMYFFQRWAFFAPPPKFDSRIYYAFFDKNNKLSLYEVLEEVDKEKQKTAPFNKKAEVLDYILQNCAISITNQSADIQSLLRFELKNKSDTSIQHVMDSKLVIDGLEQSNDFKTLLNYGKVIAKLNNVPAISCRIRIARLYIKKFHGETGAVPPKEEIVFQSNLYKL